MFTFRGTRTFRPRQKTDSTKAEVLGHLDRQDERVGNKTAVHLKISAGFATTN